jgi:hypothetical protein
MELSYLAAHVLVPIGHGEGLLKQFTQKALF